MCNARANTEFAEIAQPMKGPATDALELLKRKRSAVKQKVARDQFSFQEIFGDLTALEDEEAFPVISWNFDENEDERPPALLHTVKSATVGHSGLKRSRSSEPSSIRKARRPNTSKPATVSS